MNGTNLAKNFGGNLTNLCFIGFADIDAINNKIPTGIYNLQLNPETLSFSTDNGPIKDKLVLGTEVTSSAPSHRKRTLSMKFTLDNTGAIPNKPQGLMLSGVPINPSLFLFESTAITALNETHTQPYVQVIWGLGNVELFGKVEKYDYNYTFFNNLGLPLRVEVTLSIKEVFSENGHPLFQSPDMTRMPIVKDKDSLVQFCEEYYDDKMYYLKIAELNNLSSIRSIKNGSQLEFPPIKT